MKLSVFRCGRVAGKEAEKVEGEELKPCPFCGSTDIILATVLAWPTSCYELICADCNVVIHAEDTKSVCALWNRRVEPPNPPLTLDKLWEMDGEPVFIKELEESGHYYLDGGWRIVNERLKYALEECAYGTAFLAYRRRPEEEK